MGPIQVVVQDGNNLVLEVTPTPNTTVILDRGIAGPPGPTGPGNVNGPASATDNAVARFDGTTGKLIQNSVVTISDTGNIAGVGTLAVTDLTDSSLTSGRVTYAGTGGNLVDSANMTFNGTRLTVADLADSGLTATRVVYSAAGGALVDSANLIFNGTDLTVSGAVNAGSINATTLDLTNLEVTNIKAKDGTSSITLADSTGVATFAANPIINAGTANGVAYLNGSKVLTTGSALTFDGTSLGVGTATPGVFGVTARNVTVANSAGYAYLQLQGSSANGGAIDFGDASVRHAEIASLSGSQLAFYLNTANSGNSISEQMRLTSTGLGIGTSSPSQKLDVVGNATVSGSITSSGGDITVGTNGKFVYSNFVAQNSGNSLYLRGSGASGQIEFQTNTTTKATLDASGNLGLGVTPSAWSSASRPALQLPNGAALFSRSGSTFLGQNFFYNSSDTGTYIANGFATLYNQASGQHQWFNAPSGTAGNAAPLTQAMTLDASGNFMVGATSSSAIANKNIDVNGTGDSALVLRVGGTTTAYLYSIASQAILGTVGALPITFNPNGTERARITSGGDLLVGATATSAGAKLYVVGSGASNAAARLYNPDLTDSNFTLYVDKPSTTTTTSQVFIGFTVNAQGTGSGQINANGASQAAFGSFSDARLKENIVGLEPQLEKIMALRPVEFDYKDGSGHQTGFVAQEMQQVYPDAIGEQNGFLTVSGYGKTEARLIKAIQEQQAIITALTARVAALESN